MSIRGMFHKLGLLLALVAVCLVPASVQSQPAADSAEATPQREAFEKTFERWKAMLAELRALDIQYRNASPARQEQLLPQYNAVVEQGESLQHELIDAAMAAFVKKPDANRDLLQFLLMVVRTEMDAERYGAVVDLLQPLLDSGVKLPALHNVMGIAAYCSNRFDLAEQEIEIAQEEGVSNLLSDRYMETIPYYKEIWAREQELREAEQAANDLPRVLLRTNKGEIELELFENQAPNTVANFISLVEDGFYDGLEFHRVVPRLAAQGGCPNGDGTGGPGYRIRSECLEEDARHHFRGSIAMASRGLHDAGSQFYVTFVPAWHLDGRYTVFGRVVRGIDVLAKLQRREPRDPMQVAINPHRNVVIPPADRILEARVTRKRNHPYEPETLPPIEMPLEEVSPIIIPEPPDPLNPMGG